MTDILSGDTAYRSDSPAPPEPSVTMPLPSDTRASDAAFSVEQLGEMAESAAENRVSEREWLDNAASELKQKRERCDGLDGTPPIVEVKAARRDEPYTLREAQKEYSEGHRLYSATAALARAREAINSTRPVTDEEVRQHDQNLHELQKMRMGEKPGEVPWNPISLIEDGKFVTPLKDDQKITLDEALTPRQAAKQIGNWREYQERAQNELVEHLRGEEARRQVVEAAEQIQQQQPRPAPVQQQPRQPQADPLAAQKFQLAAQQAALAMTAEEKNIWNNRQKWVDFLKTRCPEAANPQTWSYTAQNNPKRAAEVTKEFQKAKAVFEAGNKRLGELNELRQHRANQMAQAQHAYRAQHQQAAIAQRQRHNQQADAQFNDWFAREHPELDTDQGRKALIHHAREAIREATGWNDQMIEAAYQWGPIRSPVAQRFIATAAVARMQKQNAQNIRQNNRARVSQAMAPSAGGLRSNDDVETIRSLQRKLETQTGRAALMTATELQQARRRAGRV